MHCIFIHPRLDLAITLAAIGAIPWKVWSECIELQLQLSMLNNMQCMLATLPLHE